MTTLRKATAKEGYVFKLKGTDQILGSVLYLGKEDSIDRYEQVLEVAEEEQETEEKDK